MAGSSLWPAASDNNIDRTDGIDIIQSDDINNAYAQIEAIQASQGAFGVAQSKATDLMTHLEESIPTIRLSWVNATTVQASAGRIWTKNAAPGSVATQRAPRRNAVSTNITVADLVGGGAFANNTVYYVYANGDATATTVTFKISTSSSAPGGGVTLYRKIGRFATDGSGNILQFSVQSVTGWRKIYCTPPKETQTYVAYTGVSVVPDDDTLPQSSEGAGITALDIDVSVESTANEFRVIYGLAFAALAGQNTALVFSLYKNTDTDPIKVYASFTPNNGALSTEAAPFFRLLGSDLGAGKHTLKLRGGNATATDYYLNGNSSARRYGGKLTSFVIVEEWEEVYG